VAGGRFGQIDLRGNLFLGAENYLPVWQAWLIFICLLELVLETELESRPFCHRLLMLLFFTSTMYKFEFKEN
jgi:hypothetical protein